MCWVFLMQLERHKAILEDLKAEHNKKKVSINSQLHQLQKLQEVMSDKNEMKEQKFGAGKKELRQAVSRLKHCFALFPLI